MSGPSRPPARMGLESPAPVFAARNLDAAMAFYDRLGFTVRRYDSGYGYAEREGLRIHLRASPEIERSIQGVDALVRVNMRLTERCRSLRCLTDRRGAGAPRSG